MKPVFFWLERNYLSLHTVVYGVLPLVPEKRHRKGVGYNGVQCVIMLSIERDETMSLKIRGVSVHAGVEGNILSRVSSKRGKRTHMKGYESKKKKKHR